MKSPYDIIVRPHITEKSMMLSYGNDRLSDEEKVRTYTFEVAMDCNKLEIKEALEAIYNAGKKKDETITVTSVRTVKVHGKVKRVGFKSRGARPDRKKAYITLAPGQMLEDYGV